MGGRSGNSGMGSSVRESGSPYVSSVTVDGATYSLPPQDITDNTVAYMNWLNKGAARMHAVGVIDNHEGYSDDHLMGRKGGNADLLARNAVQLTINDQGNKSRFDMYMLDLSGSQEQTLLDAVKDGVRKWYEKDSATKAGAAYYRKLRRTYNPETGMYSF